MYLRNEKYILEGNTVKELVNGNWSQIAVFSGGKDNSIKASDAALKFYKMIIKD